MDRVSPCITPDLNLPLHASPFARSWDRVPYLTTLRNGSASPLMADNVIEGNFLVAGGGANGGAVDNDDGSSFYRIERNFLVYGGHKSDFDGHSKRSSGNLLAYAAVYGSRCVGIQNLPAADPAALWAEGFRNNTCILAGAGDPYLDLGDGCDVGDPALPTRMLLGGNTVLAPGGNVTVTCGRTVGELPASATIVRWAAELLGVGM
jgi:hypothetical protein